MSSEEKEKSAENNGSPLSEAALERIAREMSDALLGTPRLLDEFSARLPTEFSFVLRQLPHDPDAMTNFVKTILPYLDKERKLNVAASEEDKIDLFFDLMDHPEFSNWIIQAITGKSPQELLESGTPEWLAKSQQGADLLEQRRFEESRLLLQEALEECDRERPNSLWSYAILRALAVACGGAGDVEQLEPLLNRWIDSAESKLGDWHPELAYPYSMMALVREEQERPQDAENLYKRSIEILQRFEKPDSEEIVNAIHELGFFYFRQKRFAESEPLLKQVLEALTEQEQAEENKIEYYEALAEAEAKQGKFASIEPYCRNLLSFAEAEPEKYETSWYPLGLLACSFLAQEKCAEASVVLESAIEKMKKASVEDNERVKLVLDSYVRLLKEGGREREALYVTSVSQKVIYQQIDIQTQKQEVMSDELPIEIIAKCFFRLTDSEESTNWQFMDVSERQSRLRDILVGGMKEFFASTDFLKICTDFKEVEEEFQSKLVGASQLQGLDIIFQFHEFADKGGFLQILGKLQRAIQLSSAEGKSNEAEQLFEQSLSESGKFPRSDLGRYVKEIYIDYLLSSGQEERARQLREKDS